MYRKPCPLSYSFNINITAGMGKAFWTFSSIYINSDPRCCAVSKKPCSTFDSSIIIQFQAWAGRLGHTAMLTGKPYNTLIFVYNKHLYYSVSEITKQLQLTVSEKLCRVRITPPLFLLATHAALPTPACLPASDFFFCTSKPTDSR